MRPIFVLWFLFLIVVSPSYSQKTSEEFLQQMEFYASVNADSVIIVGEQYLTRTELHSNKAFHFQILKKIVKALFQQGQLKKGQKLINRLKVIQLKNQREEVELDLLQAEMYEYDQKTDSASIYYLKAIQIATDSNYQDLLALSYGNFGSMYLYMNDYESCKVKLSKAREIFERIDEGKQLAIVYNNLGVLYRKLDDLDSSLFYYKQAEEIRLALKDESGLADVYMNMGIVEEAAKNYELSDAYYQQSKEISERINNQTNLLLVNINLGNLNLYQEKYDVAESYYQNGLEITEAGNFSYYKKHLYLCLSRLFEWKGDYEKSLDYSKEYNEAYKEYLSESKDKTIQELEKKYESEKIKAENVILVQENEREKLALQSAIIAADDQKIWILWITIIALVLLFAFSLYYILYRKKKNRNDELQVLIAEREMLLKEIHHRVKNNLQIVSSLLNMQKGFVSKKTGLEILKDSQDRINSMSLLHESLYKSDRLNEINFKDYVAELTKNLTTSLQEKNNEISVIQDVAEDHIDLDYLVPCGLIINELVTNAIKYAFVEKGKGEIAIKSKFTDGICNLSIGDNGKGLDAGFSLDNLSSLGLRLVHGLVRQMKGEIEVLDNQPGVLVNINFKAK